MDTSDKIAGVALIVAIVSGVFSWHATQTANETANLGVVMELGRELDSATFSLMGALDRATATDDMVTPALEWERRFQTVKDSFDKGISSGTIAEDDWKKVIKGPCELFAPLGFVARSDGKVLLSTLQGACKDAGLT